MHEVKNNRCLREGPLNLWSIILVLPHISQLIIYFITFFIYTVPLQDVHLSVPDTNSVKCLETFPVALPLVYSCKTSSLIVQIYTLLSRAQYNHTYVRVMLLFRCSYADKIFCRHKMVKEGSAKNKIKCLEITSCKKQVI